MNRQILLLLLIVLLTSNIIQSQSSNGHSSEINEWEEKGWKNPEIDFFSSNNIYSENYSFTHSLDLILVNFRGSGWTKPLIKKDIRRVAEVYGQIGVKISNVKYVEAYPPFDLLDVSIIEEDDRFLVRRSPIKLITDKRLIVYFIRSETSRNETAYSYIVSRNNSGERIDRHKNTAWISYEVNSDIYINEREKGYSPIAHELAHILCDMDHTDGVEDNILSPYYDGVNSSFNDEQIRAIYNSSLVSKL